MGLSRLLVGECGLQEVEFVRGEMIELCEGDVVERERGRNGLILFQLLLSSLHRQRVAPKSQSAG